MADPPPPPPKHKNYVHESIPDLESLDEDWTPSEEDDLSDIEAGEFLRSNRIASHPHPRVASATAVNSIARISFENEREEHQYEVQSLKREMETLEKKKTKLAEKHDHSDLEATWAVIVGKILNLWAYEEDLDKEPYFKDSTPVEKKFRPVVRQLVPQACDPDDPYKIAEDVRPIVEKILCCDADLDKSFLHKIFASEVKFYFRLVRKGKTPKRSGVPDPGDDDNPDDDDPDGDSRKPPAKKSRSTPQSTKNASIGANNLPSGGVANAK